MYNRRNQYLNSVPRSGEDDRLRPISLGDVLFNGAMTLAALGGHKTISHSKMVQIPIGENYTPELVRESVRQKFDELGEILSGSRDTSVPNDMISYHLGLKDGKESAMQHQGFSQTNMGAAAVLGVAGGVALAALYSKFFKK